MLRYRQLIASLVLAIVSNVVASADLLIALIGLTLLGVGLWWKDPGVSLAVVGGVVFIVSVVAQFRKGRPPG